VIDFGRDAALTVTLTGNNRWGIAANFDATADATRAGGEHRDLAALILKKSGAVVTDIVFTTTPWQKFLNADPASRARSSTRSLAIRQHDQPGAQMKKGASVQGPLGPVRPLALQRLVRRRQRRRAADDPDGT
jgi:hypothetical protein